MNPGDIILYWRLDATRSLAMEQAVKRVAIWPQSVESKHSETRVTLYGGFVEFEAPEMGELNTYGADGSPSDPVSVSARESLPEDGHFPVTAFFRFSGTGPLASLPACRVECQMSARGTLKILPGAVLVIEHEDAKQ